MAVQTKLLLSHRFDKSASSLCYPSFLSTLPFFCIAHFITFVNTHLDNCTATSSSNMCQTYFQNIFGGCEKQHQFQITPGLPLKAIHTHPASSLKALLFHSPSSLSCYLSPFISVAFLTLSYRHTRGADDATHSEHDGPIRLR